MKKILALFAAATLMGCLSTTPPPQPPSPPPATPTPDPTPIPTPPVVAPCVPLTQFGNPPGDQLHVNYLAFVVVDATPKVKDLAFCKSIGFTGAVCPLGPEGTESRAECEGRSGPYIWTYQRVNEDGSVAPLYECGADESDPVCFNNNGNPLQIKIRKPTLGGSVCILSDPYGVAACAPVVPSH